MARDWDAARRLWNDPIIRFLLVGGVLFGIHGSAARNEGEGSDRGIVVTQAVLQELIRERQRAGEVVVDLERLVADYVEEELLWREGKKLGLDNQDPIVRRRVIQKMLFLAEDSVGMEDPGDAELQRFFEAHASEFALPVRISLVHVFFSPQRRGDNAEQDARSALSWLEAAPRPEEATALGDPAIMGSRLSMRSERELRAYFGDDFTSRMLTEPPGRWFGPVRSSRGVHVVRIEHREDGHLPRFADVRSAVHAAWMLAEQRSSRQKLLDDLRRAYSVEIEPEAAATTLSEAPR
jgi:peptidyl-prolyl cis-trans isomerase C